MTDTTQKATVVIEGKTDGVSAKLKEVADGTERIKKSSEGAAVAQEKWGDKLDRIDSKMQSFQGSIDKVNKVLGAGGLAATAMAAGQAIDAMAQRANQVALANQALKISIQGARDATMGMVADYDLVVAANKAVGMGVVKTDREFAALAKTAAKLGLTMGQDAGKSVDDLTTALARQSPMILDNLGITMKVEEANSEYAARIGKVADALTDAEKKQAFMTIGLERATQAADKANVSLDTHAAQINKASAEWQNLKDNAASAGTGLLVFLKDLVASDPLIGSSADSLAKLRREAEKANSPITDLKGEVASIASVFGMARSESDAFADSLFRLQTEQIKGIAAGKSEEDQARQSWLAYRSGNEELRKNLELEERRKALAAQANEIDNRKRRGKGKGKDDVQFDNLDRFADQTVGVQATNDIQTGIAIEANNEALQRQLQLREDRIAIIQHEQEIAALQVEGGLLSADAEEVVAQRKYLAEQDLLNFQIEAATTRAEIIDLETARRNKALQEQQRQMLKSQQAENKALQLKQATYQQYGSAVAGAIGAVTMAAIEGANGQDHAAARVIAAVGKQIRNQLIMTAIQEGVLAIASAASFNYLGAAQHGIAAGVATGGAIMVGSIAGVAGAMVPPTPPASSGGGGDRDMTGPSGGSSSSSKSKSRDGSDDDGVPTSYYDGGLYSKRPDRMPQAAANGAGVVNNNNITVLGATTDQVALALRRVQDQGAKSLGPRVR